MNTFVALFRGINVGGNNILPMKDLVLILEGLGCDNVQTYIQSGNAVFSSKKKLGDKFAGEISSGILARHGFKPKVMLLQAAELQEAIKGNPYKTEDGKALHFYFLDAKPTKPDLEKLNPLKTKTEEFTLGKKVFYLYTPEGIGRSKLAVKIEQALGVPATARNWNTVRKIVEMMAG